MALEPTEGSRTSAGSSHAREALDKSDAVPTEKQLDEAGAHSETSASSDTEADSEAEPAGSGQKGLGDPISVWRGRRKRDLQDGGGLCSWGKWIPEKRPCCHELRVGALRAALLREVERMTDRDGHGGGWTKAEKLLKQAHGTPFDPSAVESLRKYACSLFGTAASPRRGDREMTIQVRLLQCIMRAAQDPDCAGIDKVVAGVPLGVGVRLPRTPAVYPKKKKWALEGQEDPTKWQEAWDVWPERLVHSEELRGLVSAVAVSFCSWTHVV